MSRWFRFYSGVIADAKAQMLPPELFKHWVNVLCIAAQNNGELPPVDVTAFMLGRMPVPKAAEILAKLHNAELLDKTEKSFKPHNWDARQYKHDRDDPTNTERQERFRNKKRNGSNGESNASSNGSNPVLPKRPDSTEYSEDSKKNSEATASGAPAPIDHRKRLFDEGLPKFARLTGKGPDACRSFVGKCLKAASDDAITVLGLIEEAERNQVVDPSAWIAARLKSVEIGNAKPSNGIIQAADDLRRKIAGFDGPSQRYIGIRDG